MIEGLFAIHVVADKAYDADYIINKIKQQRAILVIPPKRNRRDQRSYDAHIYKDRHLVACFFCKIKEFRRVATRYEKLATTFLAMVSQRALWMASCKAGNRSPWPRSTNCTASPKPLALRARAMGTRASLFFWTGSKREQCTMRNGGSVSGGQTVCSTITPLAM